MIYLHRAGKQKGDCLLLDEAGRLQGHQSAPLLAEAALTLAGVVGAKIGMQCQLSTMCCMVLYAVLCQVLGHPSHSMFCCVVP